MTINPQVISPLLCVRLFLCVLLVKYFSKHSSGMKIVCKNLPHSRYTKCKTASYQFQQSTLLHLLQHKGTSVLDNYQYTLLKKHKHF